MTVPQFPGVRDPDVWQVDIEGCEEPFGAWDTEAEAERRAAEERSILLQEWREDNGDEEYVGPSISVTPVWIGNPQMPGAVSFDVVVGRLTIDEDCATLDVSSAMPMPEGKRAPDGWCREQRGWFAGLNDEADEDVRIALYGSDGRAFSPVGRVRVTLTPLSDETEVAQ